MFDADTDFNWAAHKAIVKSRKSNYHVLKRALDIVVVAAMAVPVCAVVLLCALAIKISAGGPVFFQQARYGADRSKFFILKLRTMSVAESGDRVEQAKENDDRVTRVGAFLRKLSLDELPQLWNVAKGEMSIVGPRPHATAHDDSFGPMIPGYDARFMVKPGITGLAQVRGQRGPTPTIAVMAERVKSDVEYVSRMSLATDLQILARTVTVVLRRTNAF